MFHSRRYVWPLGLAILFLLGGCGYNGTRSATDAVILQVGATSYQPGDTIRVTIMNQSKQTISFPDHQTNCTVLLLEHQEGSSWKPVAPCKLMTMTRLQSLKAGATLDVALTPSQQWSSGMYRAKLDYEVLSDVPNANVGIGPAKTVYSSEFRVAVGGQSQ